MGSVTLKAYNNVLNSLESSAYNMTLTMVSPGVFKSPDRNLDQVKGIIVCQSGVTTRYTINRVMMEDMLIGVNGSLENRTSSISLDVVEPYGFTFFDALMAGAQQLGIQDVTATPMLLTIKFIGYEDDGTSKEVSSKTYSFKILNITPRVDLKGAGSRYEMTGIVMNHTAFAEDTNSVQGTVSLSPDDIDGSFRLQKWLAILQAKLNDKLKRDEQFGPEFATQYEFILYGDMLDWEFKMSQAESLLTTKQKRGIATLWPGSNLVSQLLEIVKNAGTPANLEDKKKYSDTEFKKTISIFPTTSLIRYNTLDNDYVKKIQFHIRETAVPRLLTRRAAEQNDTTARAQKLVDDGVLKKVYEYSFTGKNLDVLDLELNYETEWFQRIGRYTNVATNNPQDTSAISTPKITPEAAPEFLINTNPYSLTLENMAELQERSAVIDSIAPRVENTGRIAGGSSIPGSTARFLEGLTAKTATILSPFERTPQKIMTSKYGKNEIIGQGVQDNYKAMNDLIVAEANENISMLELNLYIKGDPFWLGPSDQEYYRAITNNNGTTNLDSVNSLDYQPYIFMRFFSSGGPNEDTGFFDVNQESVFNGFYSVITIEHLFDNGLFTQRLRGMRDLTIKTSDLQIAIDYGESSGPQGAPSSGSGLG